MYFLKQQTFEQKHTYGIVLVSLVKQIYLLQNYI